MTAQRPTFRVLKNGYDRFSVDDAIDRYAAQVEQLEQKITLYQQQLVETNRQLEEVKAQYQQMVNTEASRKEASDSIARLSLREANEIINTAQKNADQIIKDAVGTARLILVDLSKLYGQAGDVKSGMKDQLNSLMEELDHFEIPAMPDLRWLNEAEKKLH
jgi:cell division initiation protein